MNRLNPLGAIGLHSFLAEAPAPKVVATWDPVLAAETLAIDYGAGTTVNVHLHDLGKEEADLELIRFTDSLIEAAVEIRRRALVRVNGFKAARAADEAERPSQLAEANALADA